MKATLFLIAILFVLACKKDMPVTGGTLYDKPLDVIEVSIRGKWQLHYMYGGYSGNFRIDYNNSFMTFNDDHVLWTTNDTTLVNSNINWLNTYVSGWGKTNLLQISNFSSWIVDRIYNDTLILQDNVSDGYSYHLTRK